MIIEKMHDWDSQSTCALQVPCLCIIGILHALERPTGIMIMITEIFFSGISEHRDLQRSYFAISSATPKFSPNICDQQAYASSPVQPETCSILLKVERLYLLHFLGQFAKLHVRQHSCGIEMRGHLPAFYRILFQDEKRFKASSNQEVMGASVQLIEVQYYRE